VSPAPSHLAEAEAIASAQADYTLAPADGVRFTDGRTQSWSGWHVAFVDRRTRPLRKSFLLYDEHVNRETVELAIAEWFQQVGR
jgi:hypothetical protein